MSQDADNRLRWHGLTADAAAQELQVEPAQGLSNSEASQRLQQVGPNVLTGQAKEPRWRAFLRQYRDYMQIILLVAHRAGMVMVNACVGTSLKLA